MGGDQGDYLYDIAVDAAGNAYVSGGAHSTNFPLVRPLPQQQTLRGFNDVTVSKLNAAGTAILYSTFLSGDTHGELGLGIAVDDQGSAYVTGLTASANFPTTRALQPQFGGGGAPALFHFGGSDAFVAKISDPLPAGRLSLSRTSVPFGRVPINTLQELPLVLTNTGTATLTGSVGRLSGVFTVLAGGGVFSLAPRGTRTVRIRYRPTARVPSGATLVITSSDPNRPRMSIPVTGTGI